MLENLVKIKNLVFILVFAKVSLALSLSMNHDCSIRPSRPAICLNHRALVCFPSKKKKTPKRTWYNKPSKCLSTFLPLSLTCSCMESAPQCFHNKHNRSSLLSHRFSSPLSTCLHQQSFGKPRRLWFLPQSWFILFSISCKSGPVKRP